MTQIVRHGKKTECELKLASGERVLIGCAKAGIRITKLKFGGLLQDRIIVNWSISEFSSVAKRFADEHNPTPHIFHAIMRKLLRCSSIKEIEELCFR